MGITDRRTAGRVSRRDFLRTSAAAGLGAALTGPAFAQSAAPAAPTPTEEDA